MRLIDADALIKTLGIAENCSDCQYQNGPLCDKNDCFVDACEAIFEQPTIDAVEVVRCGECKHWDKESTFCLNIEGCYGNETTPNWFCADGERREE